MLSYVNAFQFAVNSENNEVITRFMQNAPAFDANGKVVEIENAPIADLIMTRETAVEVIHALAATMGLTVTIET